MTRIALMGSAPSSVHLTPFDTDWLVWGCSPGAYPIAARHRIDAWFELHRYEPPIAGIAEKQVPWFTPEYIQWMSQLKCPVWTGGAAPDLPTHQEYPIEHMKDLYGPYFFTSSLSWMFAMALETKGVTEIGLWGVDMAAQEEYGDQRMGCQYFITLARQRGIKITVPPESDLLMPRALYGVGEWSPRMIKLTARRRELEARRNAAQMTMNNAHQEMLFLNGALDNIDYYLKTWMQDEPPELAVLSPGRTGSIHMTGDINDLDVHVKRVP